MKRFIYFMILFLLIVVPAYAKIVNGIACKVGRSIITINEFNRAFERENEKARYLGQPQPDKIAVINMLIDNILVRIEAEDRGIVVSEDELDTIVEDIKKQNNLSNEQFIAELEREGITVDELKETYKLDLLKTRLINQIAGERVNLVTETEVKNFYHDPENRRFFTVPGSVQLSQIYIQVPDDISYKEAVEVKKQAEEIYELAKSGQSFIELVKLYSMSPNKEENLGSLGSFTMNQLLGIVNQDGANLIFSLDEGDIAPPLRIKDGYYIFKIDVRNEQKFLSYEEAYGNIKSYLLRLKGQELLQDKLLSKRQAINVKIMIETE